MSDRTIIRSEFDKDSPLPPGLLVQLTFLCGPNQGKVEKLFKRNTILGRSEGDILLKDTAASKQHALIGFDGGRIFLRDLNSTNGTLVNGGQVWEAFLNPGDEITIGSSVIKVDIKQLAASASWANMGGEVGVGSGTPEASGDVTNVQAEWEGQDPLAKPLFPGVKAGLQVISGLDSGLKYVMKKRAIVIGRAGADIELHDMDVSRKHCSIEFMSPERVILKDLRSKNGTFLNQKWASISNLSHGDAIKIGNTIINFFVSFGK